VSTTIVDRPSGLASWEWRSTLLLGITTVVLGLVLIANPFASARTLAILVAVGIVADGVLEIARSRHTGHPGMSAAAGAVLVVGGLVALFWPQITLWALAVIVGMSIFLGGAVRLTAAIADRRGFRGWFWLLISGLLGLLVGLVAVAWPKATVVVLAVLFGLHITIFGFIEIAAALSKRQAARGAL
jgi:uncharacterized membrane protein HdeD (DUF308 family)